jgi:hypothetical protein
MIKDCRRISKMKSSSPVMKLFRKYCRVLSSTSSVSDSPETERYQNGAVRGTSPATARTFSWFSVEFSKVMLRAMNAVAAPRISTICPQSKDSPALTPRRKLIVVASGEAPVP